MECGRFVENKLGDGDSPEFRDHLADCGACRQDLEEFREIRTLYRSASVERYRGGVPRVARRAWHSWVSAAAAALMLGVLGLFLFVPVAPQDPVDPGPTVFFRVHLEPWEDDARYSSAMDDAWRKLEQVEKDW